MNSLQFATYTNNGSRSINEDCLNIFERGDKRLFVLCDGLGGHGMGDVASQLVVNAFHMQFEDCLDISEFLPKAFNAAQVQLIEEQKKRNADKAMKTTCVAIATDSMYAYIGHIGDSRLYIFRRNKVKLRTLDHSVPQMLVLSREIKENEIRYHPDRNSLLRVMGVEWQSPQYDLMEPITLKKCQAFLLCSDGFWENIEEKTMCDLLKKASNAEEWLNLMSEKVLESGAGSDFDNNSAIAIWNKWGK